MYELKAVAEGGKAPQAHWRLVRAGQQQIPTSKWAWFGGWPPTALASGLAPGPAIPGIRPRPPVWFWTPTPEGAAGDTMPFPLSEGLIGPRSAHGLAPGNSHPAVQGPHAHRLATRPKTPRPAPSARPPQPPSPPRDRPGSHGLLAPPPASPESLFAQRPPATLRCGQAVSRRPAANQLAHLEIRIV